MKHWNYITHFLIPFAFLVYTNHCSLKKVSLPLKTNPNEKNNHLEKTQKNNTVDPWHLHSCYGHCYGRL